MNHVYFNNNERPKPEYILRRVMFRPIHDQQLTKDCKEMTNN